MPDIVYHVYSDEGARPRLESIHATGWGADWAAWKLALEEYGQRNVVWMEDPAWGYPGWVCEGDVEAWSFVLPVKVRVP